MMKEVLNSFHSTLVRLRHRHRHRHHCRRSCFHSTLVRLRRDTRSAVYSWLGSFHSTLVRLRPMRCRRHAVPPFRFHSTLVRLRPIRWFYIPIFRSTLSPQLSINQDPQSPIPLYNLASTHPKHFVDPPGITCYLRSTNRPTPLWYDSTFPFSIISHHPAGSTS